jgi:integrase
MGSIYKRGKIWHIQYYHNGKCHRETTHSKDERVAKEILKVKEVAAMDGKIPDQIRKITLSEILADLETSYIDNDLRSLRRVKISSAHLFKYFGDCPIKSITSSKIGDYIRHRKDEGKANGTINREVAALRKAFKRAKEFGKISVIPHFPHLKESEPRQGFIEYPQYLNLLKVLPPHLHLVLSLGFNVGMRKGEVLSLQWDQFDPSTNEIRLTPEQCKNKSGRTVPLLGDLAEMIPAAFSKRDGCPYICSHWGRPITDFNHAWETATKEVGLQGLLYHDLRRSAVRNMVRSGIPEVVARAITGHKTRAIFDPYNIVDFKSDFEDAKHKMGVYLNGKHNSQHSNSINQQSTSDVTLYSSNSEGYELPKLIDFKSSVASLDTAQSPPLRCAEPSCCLRY